MALPSWGAASNSPWELGVEQELRLRTGDSEQERRTTSLNWADLASESHRFRLSRVLRVMLDPGHGGHDGGAHSSRYYEKEMALRLAHLVREELERRAKQGGQRVEVRLTRTEDEFLPLGRRVAMANDWEADLFLSLHGNSSTYRSARGFEVYFLNEEATDRHAQRIARLENASETELPSGVLSILSDVKKNQHVNESGEFAERLYAAMARRLPTGVRGVRQAPFRVLNGTEMPALLLEVGYLTNPKEARLLSTEAYLRRLAGAISSGILEFAARHRRFS